MEEVVKLHSTEVAPQPQLSPNAQKLRTEIRAMNQALLGRMSWMSRAGMTFEGSRDLWATFGYNRYLRSSDLYIKYQRQDVAKTIVEAPSDALWTRPPKIKADTAFLDAWAQLNRDIDIWDIFRRIDYCLGWSRMAIIVLGLDDGLKLDAPASLRPGTKVLYMQPYSELGVQIHDYDNDPNSSRFGLPVFYQISINETEHNQAGRSLAVPRVAFKVHWTRVIHCADNVVEDNVFGRPRLEPVYNLLDDLLKIAGGSAETYWLTANRGMQMDLDKEMALSSDDAAALEDEVEEYHHNLRRFMRTRGVTITELGTRTASSKDPVDTVLSLISATTRIPKRLLMGSEAGQLASEQDRANWAERVDERREKFGRTRIVTPAVRRLVDLGVLPEPGEWSLLWPNAFILGPLEAAQTSAQMARSAANLTKVLTDQPKFLTIDEARKIVGFSDESSILDDGTPKDSALPA
jgi:hypothetical protein